MSRIRGGWLDYAKEGLGREGRRFQSLDEGEVQASERKLVSVFSIDAISLRGRVGDTRMGPVPLAQ